ncbi:MAG TPA: DNA primase [Candidatus Paceibacterota bacterium]|nr:DNA primase [Candidatus Paceibacterota bacterium]
MRSPVEEIKERLNILDIIGQYVELKRAGKSYKGKSPFTNEKTPSFYVSPDRGMYYCFSSQQGGDMFTFIEKMEGVDFKGALKILAEKAHVELVPEDPKKRDARETAYALLEEATRYFEENLREAPEIRKYVEERGVTGATIQSFRIGYAKDEWRALRAHLKEKGFTDEALLAAGLAKRAEGKEPYDVFRDRVMFPIMDPSGRVVAFSGRTRKAEEGVPKYVNSPETDLFQKSEILYGYDKAKHGIRSMNFALIVEGQFDLVLSHQAGYVNAVAVSGTALTPHHVGLLTRISKNVVLSLDADRAGITAVKRSAGPMLEAGMDVKVAELPEGEDPADVVRKDPKRLKAIVGKSVHVVEFLLKTLKSNAKDERTYKLRVREEVLPLLSSMDNRIDREHFEGVVAEYIESTKEGVHFEVERIAEAKKHERRAAVAVVAKKEKEEKGIEPNRKKTLEDRIQAYMHIAAGERAWLGKRIREELEKVLGDDAMALFASAPSAEATALIFRLEEDEENLRERELLEQVSDALTQYMHAIARERIRGIKVQVREAEESGKGDDALLLLKEAKAYEKFLASSIVLTKEGE